MSQATDRWRNILESWVATPEQKQAAITNLLYAQVPQRFIRVWCKRGKKPKVLQSTKPLKPENFNDPK
jgi:hypothetical protein